MCTTKHTSPFDKTEFARKHSLTASRTIIICFWLFFSQYYLPPCVFPPWIFPYLTRQEIRKIHEFFPTVCAAWKLPTLNMHCLPIVCVFQRGEKLLFKRYSFHNIHSLLRPLLDLRVPAGFCKHYLFWRREGASCITHKLNSPSLVGLVDIPVLENAPMRQSWLSKIVV